ncbi:MAG: caspase family protein [Prevotella sp.]|nr:caspase family protein [Prevotella sp.]
MKSKSITKLILLLLLVVGITNSIHAQYLHTIMFADTNDPKIGEGVLQDFYSLSVEVSTIASATGMKLKSYYFKGDECSNRNLQNILDQLKTNEEDVVLFYYSGHGTRAAQDNSDYPQMCLGSHYNSDFYPMEKVLKKLERQPARLKLIIGDCCNNIVNGVTPKDYEARSVTVLSKEPVNVYNSLFNNNEGYLIASGSQKGETSINLGKNGGAFTICLLGSLRNYASKGLEATWNDVMATAQAATKHTTSDYGHQHTPVYAVNIHKETPTEVPSATTSTSTLQSQYQEPQNTAVDDGSNDVDMITLLTAIANENVSIEKRVKVQEKALKGLFNHPNVKVEVVASNGSTIVATERASDFVLRLCTAHNLINLVEVDKTLDSQGRYTYLKVHEIYKK